MSKIVLSGAEFSQLCDRFAASTPGLINWKDFADCVDEVFTKKGLEQSVDIILGDARTASFYGKPLPDSCDQDLCEAVRDRFRVLVRRQRLDAKSFF
jgi:hypothetical protein